MALSPSTATEYDSVLENDHLPGLCATSYLLLVMLLASRTNRSCNSTLNNIHFANGTLNRQMTHCLDFTTTWVTRSSIKKCTFTNTSQVSEQQLDNGHIYGTVYNFVFHQVTRFRIPFAGGAGWLALTTRLEFRMIIINISKIWQHRNVCRPACKVWKPSPGE